jgi:hypothetical protein
MLSRDYAEAVAGTALACAAEPDRCTGARIRVCACALMHCKCHSRTPLQDPAAGPYPGSRPLYGFDPLTACNAPMQEA